MANATTNDLINLEGENDKMDLGTSELGGTEEQGQVTQKGDDRGLPIIKNSEVLTTPLEIKKDGLGKYDRKLAGLARDKPLGLVLNEQILHRSSSLSSMRDSKRKRHGSDESLSLEEPLQEYARIKAEMIDCLWSEKSRLTKDMICDVAKKIDMMANITHEILNRNRYLEGQLDLLREIKGLNQGERTQTSNEGRQKRDYARVTKERIAKTPVVKERFMTMVVMEGEDGKDSDIVKGKLLGCMNPAKEKINIKGVRKLKTGAVMVETQTEADLIKFKNSEKIYMSGLRTKDPKPPEQRNPRILIYDIDRNLGDDLENAIRESNEEIMGGIEEHKRGIKPLFKTGKKESEVTNWVLEVSAEMRKVLLDKGKVGIGWRMCRVADYIPSTRCYKCQNFGHVSRYCKATEETCGHCSTKGHRIENCPNKGQKPTCSACKTSKKPFEHRVGEVGCAALKSYMERVIRNTKYE